MLNGALEGMFLDMPFCIDFVMFLMSEGSFQYPYQLDYRFGSRAEVFIYMMGFLLGGMSCSWRLCCKLHLMLLVIWGIGLPLQILMSVKLA